MRDPEGERLGNGLFIGEAALSPLSLELPVQIRWQPHGCFDRGTGAHTTPLLKFGIFLRNANAERCASRVYPAPRPSFFCGCLCSSIRTKWNPSFMSFIRSQGWMQEICSEFRTNRRSNLGCSGTSVPVRRRARHAQAWCLGRPAHLLAVCSPDRRGASLERMRQKFSTISLYVAIKSGTFAVLLLANRWYLLYKV
jgi:hypothetical protein